MCEPAAGGIFAVDAASSTSISSWRQLRQFSIFWVSYREMISSLIVSVALLCSLACFALGSVQPVEIGSLGDISNIGGVSPRSDAVIYRNLPYNEIFEHEVADGNFVTSSGTVEIDTGRFTGRSPKDKYIVKRSPSAEHVSPINNITSTSDTSYVNIVMY